MNTITLDKYARFDRRRGRTDHACPTRRIKADRLDAIVSLASTIPFLPTIGERARAERSMSGLIRLAALAGADTAELAGATGRPKTWVKGQIKCLGWR